MCEKFGLMLNAAIASTYPTYQVGLNLWNAHQHVEQPATLMTFASQL